MLNQSNMSLDACRSPFFPKSSSFPAAGLSDCRRTAADERGMPRDGPRQREDKDLMARLCTL